MLQIIVIGHLGGDAEVKTADGREFITFRVAHTDSWTDDAGQVHETTSWIDCTMDGKPKVFEFLKRGTQVYVAGAGSTRLYSSAKDRCMKAGLQVRVRSIQLLGGKADPVPSRLYDANDGHEFVVNKYFQCPELVRDEKQVELYPVVSRSGKRYVVDCNGWISEFKDDSNGTELQPEQ